VVVGIDPGRNVGVAFVHQDGRLERALIITLDQLTALNIPLDTTLVVGGGTGSKPVQALLRRRRLAFVVLDERGTSLEARSLYFRDHPPKGLRRLIPQGLWWPPRPLDDYAAYAIALRYLKG
jgi:RNase H-fold protein (predicted Holliday junction resolvase)